MLQRLIGQQPALGQTAAPVKQKLRRRRVRFFTYQPFVFSAAFAAALRLAARPCEVYT